MNNETAPVNMGLVRWRCRRGLLENDLFIERFFSRYGDTLTEAQSSALLRLMELSDNDLMDLFMRRTEPSGTLDVPEVREVLENIRRV